MSAQRLTTLRLGFPSNLEVEQVVAFARAISARPSAHHWPLWFELRARAGSVEWLVHVNVQFASQMLASLHAHLPSVRVEDLGTEQLHLPTMAGRLAIEIRLSSYRRPLRTDVAAELAIGVLAVAGRLHDSEHLRLQWLVGHPLKRQVVKPEPTNQRRDFWERTYGPEPLDAEQARRANDKQAEPVVAALGRIAVAAATPQRRRSIVTSTLGALRVANQPSVHVRARMLPSAVVTSRVDRFQTPWFGMAGSAQCGRAGLPCWPGRSADHQSAA